MKRRLLSLLTIPVLLLSLILPTASAAETAEPAETAGIAGDADGDGMLTILDAVAIRRHLSGIMPLSESGIRRGMVTGGRKLSILDATAIQRKIARTITRFPCDILTEPPEITEQQDHAQENDILGVYEQQAVSLINGIRQEHGLSVLSVDPALCRVACFKSQDMHDLGSADLTSPTYGTPQDMLLTFGISYHSVEENIALGYYTPQAVVNGWINSEGYRENILNSRFSVIGIGYVADGGYWTVIFTD